MVNRSFMGRLFVSWGMINRSMVNGSVVNWSFVARSMIHRSSMMVNWGVNASWVVGSRRSVVCWSMRYGMAMPF